MRINFRETIIFCLVSYTVIFIRKVKNVNIISIINYKQGSRLFTLEKRTFRGIFANLHVFIILARIKFLTFGKNSQNLPKL